MLFEFKHFPKFQSWKPEQLQPLQTKKLNKATIPENPFTRHITNQDDVDPRLKAWALRDRLRTVPPGFTNLGSVRDWTKRTRTGRRNGLCGRVVRKESLRPHLKQNQQNKLEN